jgi:hypothetical protein
MEILKMKVIFLDIDGVLNTNSNKEISNDKLKLLSELVSKTGAEVVLSSSWRYGWNRPEKNQPGTRFYNLKQQLKDNDIVIKETIGLDLTKSIQIKNYLNTNVISNYVVLDDEPIDITNLVQTDGDVGLTQSDCQKAARFLLN